MNKNNHGFTLVELLVTLTVLSILLAVAAPDILFTTTSNRVTTEFNNLRGDLAFARNLATTKNLPVNISAGGTDWSGGWTISTPTDTVRVSGATNHVAISSTISDFTYNSDGTTNLTAPKTFVICNQRKGKQLIVNVAGRVSIANGAPCP